MGLCSSSAEPVVTEVVVHPDGTRTYPPGWSKYKVLILGTGGSGKSTIFKQAHILGDGFSDVDRRLWSVRIFSGLLQMARAIVSCGGTHDEITEAERVLLFSGGGEMATFDELGTWDECVVLLDVVHKVLADPKTASEALFKVQPYLLDNSAKILLKIVPRICTPDFLASNDEILRFAYPTNDVQRVVSDFPETNLALQMIDVGGQRCERAKWSGLVKQCQTVLFVTSLDDYHKTLDEDVTKNRLREALVTFRQTRSIVNKNLPDAHTLLFLNKNDLFDISLKTMPFKNFFPEYTGPTGGQAEIDGAKTFVANLFKDIHDNSAVSDVQQFACHQTSAVDTDHMRMIFALIGDMVLSSSLQESGF